MNIFNIHVLSVCIEISFFLDVDTRTHFSSYAMFAGIFIFIADVFLSFFSPRQCLPGLILSQRSTSTIHRRFAPKSSLIFSSIRAGLFSTANLPISLIYSRRSRFISSPLVALYRDAIIERRRSARPTPHRAPREITTSKNSHPHR